MSTPDLASVIDRCLDDLVAGRLTVSECLERHPEHRAAIEPILRAAASMQALPRRAERAPSPIRRAQFMELIRETPQQRRSWLPALAGLFSGGFVPRLAAAAVPVALAMVLGTFLLVSQPPTPAAASTLTVFAGAAEEQVGGQWRPLADGAAVRQGARIRTDAEGHVLLTFPDGSTSSLEPSTEIALEQLAAGTPRRVQIRQFSGHLWNDVVTDTREGARYEVLTSDATVQVQGTVFETAIDNGQTSVTTSEGLVNVVVGNERVSVPGGQLVRAQAQRVAERGPVQPTGSLTVDAPFTAALVSARGEATGARADGAIFRQIRGVTTSNPGEGPQRFEFQRLPPGDYTLLLQRFGQGGGDLVLDVNGAERRVPIDEASGTAQVRVRVDVQDGKSRVTIAEDRPRPAPAAERPAVRIVETERTKRLPDVAAQRAAAARRPATATPPRPAGATSATPPRSGTGTAAANDPFVQRLRDAVARNDATAIRALLSDAASTRDADDARAQLVILVALMNNDQASDRIAGALAADPGLRARVLDRGGALLNDELEARLRRGIGDGGNPARPAASDTPQRTPSPVRTPTPNATTPPPRPGEPPREGRNAPLPPAVDGFGIRLRIALATQNDEAIRRALAGVVEEDGSTTRTRLAALADVIEDGGNASRVDRALDGPAGGALRARLLRAAQEEAPAESRLVELLRRPSTPVPSPTATRANVTVTPSPPATATKTATPSATAEATASPASTGTR